MLQKLRSSVSGLFGIALILLLVVAFAVWGIADSFTTLSQNTIARVGNKNIDVVEFRLRFNQQLGALSRELGQQITVEQARANGIDQQVLAAMIGMAAVNNATEDMGLTLSDKAVAQSILDDPAFKGANGQFDDNLFRIILQRNGLTEKLFTKDQKDYATRAQLLDATSKMAVMPDALLDRMYDYILERRVVRYVIIPADAVGDVGEPAEEELQSFYEAARLRFSEPERRTASILAIAPDHFAANLEVTEEDIQEEYSFREAEFAKPERRQVDQLLMNDDDSIAKAREAIAAGKSFVEIVKAVGQTLDNTDLGDVTRDEIISVELADAAFALNEGEISDIIEGPLGSVILRIRSITPAEVTPLEAVRNQIEGDIRQMRANDELIKFSERILDEMSAGELFESIAQRFDLDLLKLAKIDRDGALADGSTSPLVDRFVGIAQEIFAATVGQDLPMFEAADGTLYWVRLDEVQETRSRPLSEIRDEVIAQWQKTEQQRLLEAMAEHLAEKGNSSGNFDDIEADLGRKAFTSEQLTRQSRNETFSADGISRIFAAREAEFVWAPVGFGGSLIVMQVNKVIAPSRDNDQSVATIYENERERFRGDLTNQFIGSLQTSMGVSVDTVALQKSLQAN